MIRETVNALAACLVTFVLCAIAYPTATWGLAQLAFPHNAEGSLIYGRDRVVIGSELIAQPFASDGYFHPRPSAVDSRADAAGGSNLGTKNPDLHARVKERAEALKASAERPAPTDLVSASGSGLDPDISPEAAQYQAGRVAEARKLPLARVRSLIDRHVVTSGAILGAPPRINVLTLNLALDEEKPEPSSAPTAAFAEPGAAPSTARPDLAGDLARLRTQLDDTSRRLRQLVVRVDEKARQIQEGAAVREQNRADLKDLEGRVATLTGSSRAFPELVGRVDALDERIKATTEALRTLGTEVGVAKTSIENFRTKSARR